MREYWKTITGYEDYSISTFGRVKSIKNGREIILKPFKNNNNYYVSLSRENVTYNVRPCILVLKEFLGLDKPRYAIKFVDHDRKNCGLANIYVTNGISNSRMPSVNDVTQIYLIYKNSGMTMEEISKKYKINLRTIEKICNGKSLTYITDIIESYLK